MKQRHMAWVVWMAALCSACAGSPDITPAPEPTPPQLNNGFFSMTQAERGRQTFGLVCSECHDSSDFRGEDFEWEWRRQTVWDLYRQLRETMPENSPGSLSATTYADVIAYILQLNEYASGNGDLVAEEGAMETIPLGPGADKTGRSGSSEP